MKKKLIIIILFLLAISLIYINRKQNDITKFYLDDIYYNGNSFINIDASKVTELRKSKASYVIFTYNNFCNFEISCEEIFTSSMQKNNLVFYSIPYNEFEKTYLSKKVKYAPSVIIIKKGQIIAYLDANNDEDIQKYQNVTIFDNWLNKYIYLDNE